MKFSKFLSIFLAILMVLYIIPMSVFAEFRESVTETVNDVTSSTDYATEYIAPDVIDKDEFEKNYYSGRVIEDEKNLYTLIFKNGDGSNTMRVFSHPVKYIDESGATRDISLEIYKNRDGSFTAADHMVNTKFGSSILEGINLEYNDVKVSMKMLDVNANLNAELSDDRKKLTYTVDDKTSYVYSLTYLGIKENILVNEYTGQTEYKFVLFTNGLHPVNVEGSVFLADINGNIKASIGDIIIFTADERNNTFGDLLFEKIIDNEEYIFTITIDANYLKNEKTTYPIKIDPTINVIVNDPNYGGTGAIEDITINENSTFSGTSKSLYVGRHSSGSLSRTLMRFPNLSLSGITANQITSATVEIRDLMCQGNEDITIDCCIYNNSSPSWSESGTTTWSSVGTSYVGTVLDSRLISYSEGTSSAHRYGFNILNLAKAWANNTQSPSKGIVFKAEPAFENQTGSNIKTWYKTFSSYNRDIYQPSLTIIYNESGFDNATTLSLGSYYTVSIVNSGEKQFFKYTPSTTGFYTFESSSIISGDPFGRLYNSNQDQLIQNDDGGNGNNFRITYHLVASYTYYFFAGCFSTGTGSYSIRLYKTSNSSYIINPQVITLDTPKNIPIPYAKAFNFLKFTPTVTGEYLFYSFDRSGNPMIWIYNSNLTIINSDDDTAGNQNFRLLVSLSAGQTYYISLGHYGTNTGSYKVNLLKNVNLNDTIYYFKNKGSTRYIDIEGPGAQEWVQQWRFHGKTQSRWLLQKQSGNYYVIKSEYGSKKYLGISSSLTDVDNIKLYSSISSQTKWYIYTNNNNELVFEPYNAPGKILFARNNSDGTQLRLNLISSVNDYCKWTSFEYLYKFEISHYYDQGHTTRFSNSYDNIMDYQRVCSEILLSIFGIGATRNVYNYTSCADDCTGIPVTLDKTTERCSFWHLLTDHKTRDSIRSNLISEFGSGTSTLSKVAWTGHVLESRSSNSSSSSQTVVMSIGSVTDDNNNNLSDNVIRYEYIYTLLHELSHQIGAPDHYCYDLSSDNCDNPTNDCWRCDLGLTEAPACLMSYRMNNLETKLNNGSLNNIYCSQCLSNTHEKGIITHLDNHHSD